MTNEYRHIPVLLSECLRYLELDKGDRYVDATLGGAGHSLGAARLIGNTGHLIGIDQDEVDLLPQPRDLELFLMMFVRNLTFSMATLGSLIRFLSKLRFP